MIRSGHSNYCQSAWDWKPADLRTVPNRSANKLSPLSDLSINHLDNPTFLKRPNKWLRKKARLTVQFLAWFGKTFPREITVLLQQCCCFSTLNVPLLTLYENIFWVTISHRLLLLLLHNNSTNWRWWSCSADLASSSTRRRQGSTHGDL